MFEKKGNEKKKDRFIVKYEQKLEKTFGLCGIHVIVDTQTGVNYFQTVGEGYSGLAPLMDSDGKLIVDDINFEK